MVVINWGDGSGNEIVFQNILVNVIILFFFINEYNYILEGDYVVKFYVFNFFSNEIIWKMVYI